MKLPKLIKFYRKDHIYLDMHQAYLGSLENVFFNYDYKCAPRNQPIREKLNYSFTVLNPTPDPIITLDENRNETIKEYTKKEFELYYGCTNKAEDFAEASKFWNSIANPDGTINSAYGYLIWKNKSIGHKIFEGVMRTPWEWAKLSLIKDKDTRQAFVRFSLPDHQWANGKDQTCTMHATFNIRNDELNLSVIMRSNDLVLGLVFDAPFFISLMYKMRDELKETYPNLKIGQYHHFAHSFHTYDKHNDLILKMLGINLSCLS